MSKPTLKEQLISNIQNIDDVTILKEVYRLLEIKSEDLNSNILTEEQIRIVNEAREQIKKGEYLTQEEAELKINQWLNK